MTPEHKRLAGLLGVLAVIAVLSFWPSSKTGPTAPAARKASSRGGAAVRTQGPVAVPTIAPDPNPGERRERVVRNIFAFPTPTPPPIPTPVPTPTPTPGTYGPFPTPTNPPPTPIIPPPVPYKIVGLFGPSERPIAALEDNGRLINAREGDTVDGRFIILKINRESVDFAFVDIPRDITRRVPISQ